VKAFAIANRLWRRRGVLTAMAGIIVVGCSHDRFTPTVVEEFVPGDRLAALSASDTLQLLPLHTYDGSGQSVHPDFVAPPSWWSRQLFYLAVTPYPGGNSKLENPSLYAGVDGVTWGAAPGAPVPLVKPRQGYLSDPSLVFDPDTAQLVMYYREASKYDRIYTIRSADGVTWSNPKLTITAAFSSVLSPSVVRRSQDDWVMWSVNSAPGGCHGPSTKVEMRRSFDGQTWSAPQTVDIPVGSGSYVWHIDVQWIQERNEYWALFPVKAPGTCATKAVYLATSPDGLSWHTISTPVLVAGAIPAFRDVVYRSTFAYDPATEDVTFWFSGSRIQGKQVAWRTAVQRRSRLALFDPALVKGAPGIPVASQALTAAFDPP
jgi:hypothetical protein